MAIQRAEDKTAQMQARAGAIDELIASGALDDVSQVDGSDDISRELDALSSGTDVEAELARLKASSQPAGDRGVRRAATSSRPRARRPREATTTKEHAMIVRILGEGQYDVSDDALDGLNELDAAVESAVEAGDEETFSTALAALLDGVRTAGVPHDAETRSTSPT